MAPRWRYERGEGRFKHRWSHDHAGFAPSGHGPVGKCPCHITEAIAEEILNTTAVPHFEWEDSPFPDRFYAVYQGVIYEAVPTQPGVSYHAYPWRGDLPGRPGLPRRMLRKLRDRADQTGERKAFEQWLKKYAGPGV
ncbi:MAG: hypothetical protein EA406_00450 [Rhodospirillales bacterium]|nr:MAG: hypothetical protein EA406_00450 [Rhodospirillales bacterium]